MDEIRNLMKVLLDHRQSGDGVTYRGMTMAECRTMIQRALQQPKVKFVMEAMEKSGCPIINPTKFIRPIMCPNPATASYIPGRGIVLCSNYLRFQDEVTQGVTHELIHAYDDCRAKNLKWTNCYHHACAEIRASRLSGDCHYMRELLRGHKNLRGHEPDCVRRRATSSVRANRYCTEYMTKLALDAVWDICYNDTKPFDKAP